MAVDLVNVLCGSVLDEVERARVDAAMHAAVDAAAAARPGTALLGDCVADLEHTAPRAATVLRRVCSGPLAAIFNRPSDIDLDGELCAVSLRELPHEFVPAATLLIAQWLWTRVRSQPRRRHIVLDEVGALCMHPPLRELLVQLARRCRKYGASLVVATQNVEDLLRSEEGTVVATNCATVLLGGHRAAEARRWSAPSASPRASGASSSTPPGASSCCWPAAAAARSGSMCPTCTARSSCPTGAVSRGRRRARGRRGSSGPLDVRADSDQHMGAAGRATPKMWDNRGSHRPGQGTLRPGAQSHSTSQNQQRPDRDI